MIQALHRDDYKLNCIDFNQMDVVIDIGANIGMISIYLAKKYPFLKIYSFEPVKCNYEKFKKNIELNKIPNGVINIQNKAVTKDGRTVQMFFNQLSLVLECLVL
ncbi:MAG: FkbM family methyltransferase [Endomicrobium sp.]|nr:FkbM family methyltransferase [Endomicrobium sp.]